MRLRSKLFISLAPIFMTLLTVVSIFLFDILSNSLGKEIDRSSESAQAQALIKIDEHFRSSQSDSDFMSNIQSVRELIKGKTLNKTLGLQEVIVSTFTQLKKSKPQYKEMFLLDSENKVVFSHSEDVFYNPDVDLGWLTKSTTSSHKDDDSPIVNTTLGTRIYFINDILDQEGNTIGKVILTQDTIALFIKDSAHHLDLRAPNAADGMGPGSVTEARLVEAMYVKKWVQDYQNMEITKSEL